MKITRYHENNEEKVEFLGDGEHTYRGNIRDMPNGSRSNRHDFINEELFIAIGNVNPGAGFKLLKFSTEEAGKVYAVVKVGNREPIIINKNIVDLSVQEQLLIRKGLKTITGELRDV